MVANRTQQQKKIASQNKIASGLDSSVMKKRINRNIGRPKTQSTVMGRMIQ